MGEYDSTSDRAGYGGCVKTPEQERAFKREVEKTERMINLKNKPSWHLTESEKKELISYYGLD